jgi:hypothetical protein
MKVTVLGYTEGFASNPDVSIYKNNELIGSVEKGGSVVLEIDEPCELVFKCSIRSTKCVVNSDTYVVLAFNRTTGSLTANLAASEQEAVQLVAKAKGSDNKRILWTIVFIVVALLLALLTGGL